MEQKKIIWNAISLLNNVVNDVDRCPPPVRCCSPNPPFLLWYVFFCLFFLVFWRISLALIPLTCTGDRFGPASGDAQQDLNRKKKSWKKWESRLNKIVAEEKREPIQRNEWSRNQRTTTTKGQRYAMDMARRMWLCLKCVCIAEEPHGAKQARAKKLTQKWMSSRDGSQSQWPHVFITQQHGISGWAAWCLLHRQHQQQQQLQKKKH